MIEVTIPGRGTIYVDGDVVEVMVDLDIERQLLDAGARGDRRMVELRASLEADAREALSRPAYKADAFDSDGDFRIMPGTAAHARAALLSLHADAVIVNDDEDDVEAALRGVDCMS